MTPEELETARVDVLGRKGALAGFGREMGKLTPDERAAVGKALNAAKDSLESAWEARRASFYAEALAKRLDEVAVGRRAPAIEHADARQLARRLRLHGLRR